MWHLSQLAKFGAYYKWLYACMDTHAEWETLWAINCISECMHAYTLDIMCVCVCVCVWSGLYYIIRSLLLELRVHVLGITVQY